MREKEWIPVSNDLPEQMKNVLISDMNGHIRKAFRNLGNIWIVCNTNSIASLFYKDEASVLAWMPLPNVYKKYSKQGWILIEKFLPQKDEPVLVSTKDDVYISYCRSGLEADMWWLRNKDVKGEQRVYLPKSSVVAWMPLPKSYERNRNMIKKDIEIEL